MNLDKSSWLVNIISFNYNRTSVLTGYEIWKTKIKYKSDTFCLLIFFFVCFYFKVKSFNCDI